MRNNLDNKLVNIWKEELQQSKMIDYGNSTMELDAFAFTKYIMNKWYNINIKFPDIVYDELINMYIDKYFIN